MKAFYNNLINLIRKKLEYRDKFESQNILHLSEMSEILEQISNESENSESYEDILEDVDDQISQNWNQSKLN